MDISIQRRHGTLPDGTWQALHSLAASGIVVTIENLLTTRVKYAEGSIYEIAFVVTLAVAKACGSILKAFALRLGGKQVPNIWPTSLKRLNHTSQLVGAGLVAETVPYG